MTLQLAPGLAELQAGFERSAERLQDLIGKAESVSEGLGNSADAAGVALDALDRLLALYDIAYEFFTGVRSLDELRRALDDAKGPVDALVEAGGAIRERPTTAAVAPVPIEVARQQRPQK